MKILDSHVHFWNYDAKNPEFDWIGESMSAIKKSFLPEDFIQHSNFNIQHFGCIAIQAAETWQETEFLLNLSSKHDFIKGVVGWADIHKYELIINNYTLLKGFRHIIQAKPHGFMTDDKFRYFISKLKNQNYTYDLLLKPHQLEEALELVKEFPNQKFVIDHLAKPDIRNQDFDQWKSDIQEFKYFQNVYCKISGLATEAHWQSWKNDDFKKPLDAVFETFGIDIMYGSDWPVCLLAGSYQDVLGVAQQYASQLSVAEKEKLFYQNAAKFYNVKH